MLHELATVSGGNAPFHAFTKPGVLFEKAQDSILYQSLGIRTSVIGYPRQQRFLLGGEMHFHACHCRRRAYAVNAPVAQSLP